MGSAVALAAVALVWWLAPRGIDSDAPAGAQAQAVDASGAITLSADQIKALALRFEPAQTADLLPVATLPAMVAPPANSRVAVAAQLPGIVTRIFVVEGDEVRAGQRLATVASRDMVGLSAELARAHARLGVARANAQRQAQLSQEGIIAPARADEARAQLRQAEVDVAEQGRLIGMTHGGGEGYTLTAPIGGRISQMAIETGRALDPGTAPFVIDAAGPLQARAQLPERLIGTVHPGMAARIGAAQGKVLAVGTAIDPATRSASLTASLPADASVRAGQALSLDILGPAPQGAVRVPAGAIAQLAGADVVFVRTAKGVTARRVTLAGGGAGDAVVLSGLKPGEAVAVSAVSELKALAAGE